MCTCIDFKTKDHYFGRNLDLEYRFNEKVIITPRNYPFELKNGSAIRTKYAMIGMASIKDSYPLYAEATNEKGLSMAGLYFPKNAHFCSEHKDKFNLCPYELIPYFLGLYATIAELRDILLNLNITDIPLTPDLPVAQLHWMISDDTECIIVEQMQDGLKIYDNPMGILTNNPPFGFHLANLNNYMNLTPDCPKNRFSSRLDLQQYGMGMGAIGLPGDTSPASRFVRASFTKFNSVCEDDEESSVTQFFHILDSVSVVKGTTLTKEGLLDLTTYSCCINTTRGIYYYKTYNNNQITAIRMTRREKCRKTLCIHELIDTQQIRYIN
ncbi:MAG: choloylglycine hydrolase family protein [Lachnospiraceae bacterium]|jgi:choloylglycine hydrolase|nr:choloylglycine hydrolase family protein [Lachnospiraceae bacterium]